MSHIRIIAPKAAGWATEIWIDDEKRTDISAFTFTNRVNDINVVTLEILLASTEIDSEAVIRIGEQTAALLTKAGWTPPVQVKS